MSAVHVSRSINRYISKYVRILIQTSILNGRRFTSVFFLRPAVCRVLLFSLTVRTRSASWWDYNYNGKSSCKQYWFDYTFPQNPFRLNFKTTYVYIDSYCWLTSRTRLELLFAIIALITCISSAAGVCNAVLFGADNPIGSQSSAAILQHNNLFFVLPIAAQAHRQTAKHVI